MATEGISRAAIARGEGSGWNTANRWLARAAEFALRFNDAKTNNIELIELQADEIRTFAPSKATPTWVFTSIEVCSRLWMSTVIGRRSYRSTHDLFIDTLTRGTIVDSPWIATDGFKFSARVIRQLFGVACVYGQVVKTWRNDRVIQVERQPTIGTWRRLDEALQRSQASVKLNTAYIERLNLTLRRSVSYLARRSLGHARCPRRLIHQLELTRCHYNFLRRQVGLRFGREIRTPAMVAGPAHRVMRFNDIFAPAFNNS